MIMALESVLVRDGLLTAEQVKDLQGSGVGARLDKAAMERGWLTEDQVLQCLGDEFGIDVIDLRKITIDRDILTRFPTKTIFRHELLPLYRENGHVVVAISDAFELDFVDELSTASGISLKPVLARQREISDRIKEHLGVGGDTINEMVRQQESEDDAEYLQKLDHEMGELAESAQAPSVIRLVNELLIEAVEQRASDVHIEPIERGLTIRFRVDGILQIQPVPSEINQFASAIVTRLKIMSRLNIAEKRLPQDGRINLRVAGKAIDLRVSVIPMVFGEGIVLRLLDKDRMVFNLKNVNMPPDMDKKFRQLIELPHGIVLVTGPTGSGKSTTLYSALKEIQSPEVKIITVEDPVEYQTPGLSQIQVHHKVGLTFAAGLRSILRHDPDVILIGEIRDHETAESAIQASLTGHLVFSTLHTNDAPGAITRLIDMKIESYLVASTVEGVLAQRLVRKLCKHCRKPVDREHDDFPPDFREILEQHPDVEFYKPVGCRECRESGYAGRIGVFELMLNDPILKEMTVQRKSTVELRKYVLTTGMMTLRECGWQRVLNGITSVEEVLRVSKTE
ncbi:GspE/PulE family protein [Lacunimicrobium album]